MMTNYQEHIRCLAEQLGLLLLRYGQTVTTAESCTGGGIAEAITRIAGSSAWFNAGVVTYSNQQKNKLLKVPESVLNSFGAVSEPVVKAMAKGAQLLADAELSVAVSGIAGPGGGSAEKPVGTVCFGWCLRERCLTTTHVFSGDRQQIREQTVITALKGLIRLLENKSQLD